MSFMPPPMDWRPWSARTSKSETAAGAVTGMAVTTAIRHLVLVAGLGSWLQACGGDNLLLPSAGQPSKISIVDGDHQSGIVGQMLEHPVVVEVTDPENRPVENI